MEKYIVSATILVRAVIIARSREDAGHAFGSRVSSTECWQAWGEPGTLDNDDLVEWVDDEPVLVSVMSR